MRAGFAMVVLSTWLAVVAGEPPAPVVASPATAESDARAPAVSRLSVLGADHGGERQLTYTWSSDGPGKVAFAPNGANAARQTLATFSRPGRHLLTCSIANPANRTVTSTVNVIVHPRLAAILVQPDQRTINARGTQQFTAQAKDQFGQPIVPSPDLTWTASDGGTISTVGMFTAGASAGGPYWVAATINTVSGYATFSINTPPLVQTPVAAETPVAGSTVALSARASDNRGESGLTYTWAVLGTPPAAVAFSVNGVNAARATIATFARAGDYQMRCTVKDASGLTTSADLAIRVAQTPSRMTVTPATAQVNAGTVQRFQARMVDQFAQPVAVLPAITWVAGGGRIDNEGVFTAGPVAGGPWAVTASAGALGGTAEVSVNTGPRVTTAAAVTSTPVAGTRAVLSVRGADNDGDERLRYRWSVSTPNAAPVVFAPNDGPAALATTATFSRAGTYRLLATITDPGGLTATSDVEVVVQPVLAALVLTPMAGAINLGASQAFSVLAKDQFGQPMPDRPALTWSATGGKVTDAGFFTASATGPAAVRVRSGGLTVAATLAVNAPPAFTSPASAEPHSQDATAMALRAVADDDAGEAHLVYRWTQLDGPAPLAFAANGGNTAKDTVARCAAPGSYRVRVVAADGNGLESTSETAFTVVARLATLSVHPSATRVNAGGATVCALVALDQFGRPLVPTPAVTWSASAGSVGGDGQFSAAGDVGGSVTVTAVSGSVRAEAVISVNLPPRLAEPLRLVLAEDARSARTSLSVNDDAGPAGLAWTWKAIGPAPVEIDGTGPAVTLRFARAGTYQVTVVARDAGELAVQGVSDLTVPTRLVTLAVAPTRAAVTVGSAQRFTAEASDQFSQPMPVQWSVDGGGGIDAAGVFTATTAGMWTLTVRCGERTATATVQSDPLVLPATP